MDHLPLQSFISTWTLVPFASLTSLPKAVALPYAPLNSTVYLAEAYPQQLREDGSALGTYQLNDTAWTGDGVSAPGWNDTGPEQGQRAGMNGMTSMNGNEVQDSDGAMVQ